MSHPGFLSFSGSVPTMAPARTSAATSTPTTCGLRSTSRLEVVVSSSPKFSRAKPDASARCLADASGLFVPNPGSAPAETARAGVSGERSAPNIQAGPPFLPSYIPVGGDPPLAVPPHPGKRGDAVSDPQTPRLPRATVPGRRVESRPRCWTEDLNRAVVLDRCRAFAADGSGPVPEPWSA